MTFLQLVAVEKPAVRVKVAEVALAPLGQWSTTNGYGFAVDEDGYCCVSPGDDLTWRLRVVSSWAEVL